MHGATIKKKNYVRGFVTEVNVKINIPRDMSSYSVVYTIPEEFDKSAFKVLNSTCRQQNP
jgi:hypothetical protein